MPNFILASYIPTNEKDENGVRLPIRIVNENGIVDIIKQPLPKRNKFVFVANKPELIEESEEKGRVNFQSLEMTGISFQELVVLNNKNKHTAKEIISDADLIMLSGGKIICQMNFFKEIGLKELLQGSNALVIGISAGATNLCHKVFNFPEEPADIPEPRIVNALGFLINILSPISIVKT